MEMVHTLHKVTPHDADTMALKGHKQRGGFAGDYILLTTHAVLADGQSDLSKDSNETPLAYIMVKKDFLTDYVINDLAYDSLESFLSEYTCEDVGDMAVYSEQANALAFIYTPYSDNQFTFPEQVCGSALLAFADFLASELHECGFEEAGKTIAIFIESAKQTQS